MAILERTPPPARRLRQGAPASNGEVSFSSSVPREYQSAVDGKFAENGVAQGRSASDYVFPSLDALAIPARERGVNHAGASNAYASTSRSPMISSAAASSAGRSPIAFKQLASPSSAARQRHINTSQSEMTRNEPESFSRGSPTRSPRRDGPMSASATASPRAQFSIASASQRRHSPSHQSEPVVDKAFQEQIERALASGENPFMDSKKAMMRDEGNSAFSATRDQTPTLYPWKDQGRDAHLFGDASKPSTRLCNLVRQFEMGAQSGQMQNSSETSRTLTGRHSTSKEAAALIEKRAMDAMAKTILHDFEKSQTARPARPVDREIDSAPSTAPPTNHDQLHEEQRALQRRLDELEEELRAVQSREDDAQLKIEEKSQALKLCDKELQAMTEKAQRQGATIAELRQKAAILEQDNHGDSLIPYQAAYDTSSRMLKHILYHDEEARFCAIGQLTARNRATKLRARLREADFAKQGALHSSAAECDALRKELQTVHDNAEDLQVAIDERDQEVERLQEELSQQTGEAKALQRKADRYEVVLHEKLDLERELASLREELLTAQKKLTTQKQVAAAAVARKVSPPKAAKDARSQPNLKKKQALPILQRGPASSSSPRRQPPSSSGVSALDDSGSDHGTARDDVGSDSVIDAPTPILNRNARVISKENARPSTSTKQQPNAVKADAARPVPKAFAISQGKSSPERQIHHSKAPLAQHDKVGRKTDDVKADAPVGRPLRSRAVNRQYQDETEDEGGNESERDHVSVSKTPLLPAKRGRTAKQTPMRSRADSEADVSAMQSKTPIVPKRTAKPAPSAAAAMVPRQEEEKVENVAPPQQQQKKKRRLLNVGGAKNVAGDFLNWNGDAEGALDPKLNLPFELSPVKAPNNSRGGTAGPKGRVGMTGIGTGIKAGGPGSVFRRR